MGRNLLGEGKTKRETEVLATPRPKIKLGVLAPPVGTSRSGERVKDVKCVKGFGDNRPPGVCFGGKKPKGCF